MKKKQRQILPQILPLLLIIAAAFIFKKCIAAEPSAKTSAPAKTEQTNPNSSAETSQNLDLAPDHVWQVLEKIKKTGEAPEGYVGGRTFQNREKRLPQNAPDGSKIKYREWDVQPKIEGKNRGAERLVTGDDRSAWYTSDHYRSFVRLE